MVQFPEDFDDFEDDDDDEKEVDECVNLKVNHIQNIEF